MGSLPGKYQPAGIGMTPSKTALGEFVRSRRLELGLRQVELAQQSGVHQTYLSEIEIGKTETPGDRSLRKLARALRCSFDELRALAPVLQKEREPPKTALAVLVCNRRTELSMSIENFAKKIGRSIHEAERLETTALYIMPRFVKRLAKALKLNPSNLTSFVGPSTVPQTELGQIIRLRRKELGMSVVDLAEKMGKTHQHMSHIELGKIPLCSDKSDQLIQQLARVLKLDPECLGDPSVRPSRGRKEMNNQSALAKFLSNRRAELRLTQKELSDISGLQIGTITNVERGYGHPHKETLHKLADALDCDIPSELLHNPSRKSKLTRKRTPLGDFFRVRRKQLGLTQGEVSQRVGTSTNRISVFENGYSTPNSSMLNRLAVALECEIPPELLKKRKKEPPSSNEAVQNE